LEIDTTDERNHTNTNALDLTPKSDVRHANGRDDRDMRMGTEEIREELKYTLLETDNSAGRRPGPRAAVPVAVLLLLFAYVRGTLRV